MTTTTPAAGMTRLPAAGTNRPLPAHGTLSRHKYHGCKCEPCRDAYRTYQRTRHRRKGYGTWQPLVDATPVREHLEKLNAAGIPYAVIAERVGRHTATITALVYTLGPDRPRKKRVRPDLAGMLLALTLDDLTPNRVDAAGTKRRIQALATLGWPMRRLAPHFGLHDATVSRLPAQRTVYRSTAEAVAAAYERLRHMRPEDHGISAGSAEKTRRWAARNGWRDQLWWEDMGRIDDPAFDPAGVDGELTRSELGALRRVEVEHLASFGCLPEEIAARLGMGESTVRQIVQEWRTGQRRDRKGAAA